MRTYFIRISTDQAFNNKPYVVCLSSMPRPCLFWNDFTNLITFPCSESRTVGLKAKNSGQRGCRLGGMQWCPPSSAINYGFNLVDL